MTQSLFGKGCGHDRIHFLEICTHFSTPNSQLSQNHAVCLVGITAPMDWISMLILGLLGSGHCVGMCGPLVLALPGRSGKRMPHLWYHLGRVVTYGAVGGVMGGIGGILTGAGGEGALHRLAGIQIGVSLAAAGFLLGFGLIRLGLLQEPEWLNALSPERIPGFRGVMGKTLEADSGLNYLAIGLMLGLLPCGLSYAAFTRALTAGGFAEGSLLALAFAAGTVPCLLLLGTGFSAIAKRFREPSDLLSGVLMILLALDTGYDAAKMLL
jgi:sulfite exporter TauE/SafE